MTGLFGYLLAQEPLKLPEWLNFLLDHGVLGALVAMLALGQLRWKREVEEAKAETAFYKTALDSEREAGKALRRAVEHNTASDGAVVALVSTVRQLAERREDS